MGKYFFLALCSLALFACSDGDLQIETIDFDSVSLQYCTAPATTSKNILFKINDNEALILELQSGVLNKGVVGDTIVTESTVPSQSQVTYRIFSDGVSKNYFCDDIPTVDPVVVDEVEAQDGMVIIETYADTEGTNFVHNISLSGISFVTGSGERITNLNISAFGEVTTAIP
ncbi:hypothetical protein [Flagellimonas aequoris]|uniref:Uncharacterized protein n=1 Tax=Flagellimonas aequoris TaxID=2306997 RepID=A0A418N5W7_9FLAO|nr:hypothetical protein [Allomuricauda aequoris]RIV69830.1 hypothetical protein D2U88_11805 [Allomuricauda aequoris]TXK01414.1 hypothetical protein FQ019_11695 [Allomuricauda aequoris]